MKLLILVSIAMIFAVLSNEPVKSQTYTETTKQVFLSPKGKPLYYKRLAAMLEQIQNSEAKGWITTQQAADFKKEHSEIAALVETIADPLDPNRKTVDEVETRLTALNAALYKASNEPKKEEKAAAEKPAEKTTEPALEAK